MKPATSMTSNAFVQIAGKIRRVPLRLLINAILARYLHQEGFGQYSLIIVVVMFLNLFVDLGINDIVVREISKRWERFDDYLLTLIVFKTAFSAIAVALGALAVLALGYSPEVRLAVFVGSFMLFFNVFSAIGLIANRARLEMKYAVLCDLVSEVVFFLLVVLATRFSVSLMVIIACWLFSRFVHGVCMLVITFRRYRPRLGRVSLGSMFFLIRESFAIWLAQIMAVTYSYIDVLMLSKFSGEEAVGLYNASFSLIQHMLFVPLAIMNSVFPVMCRYHQTSLDDLRALFQKSLDIMLVMAMPMAVVGTLYASDVVVFLYGQEFAASANALEILIWGCALMFVSTVMPFTFIACHHQNKNLYFGITGVVLNISLNLVLIPRYSFVGASIATVATEVTVLLITIVVICWLIRYVPSPKVFLKSGLASVGLWLTIHLLQPYGDLLALAAGIAVFAGMFWLLRIFSKSELLAALGRTP